MEEKEKKEDDELEEKTDRILKKIKEEMKLSEEVLQRKDRAQTLHAIIKNDTQNLVKIEGSHLEFVEINDDFSKIPNNCPFNEVCSICSSKIYYTKYICLICRDCILCSICEEEHLHPVLKCKQNQLSTLKDIYNYINKNNEEIQIMNNNDNSKIGGIFSDFFSSKYELKIDCNSLDFSIRPKHKISLPITIQNLSNREFDCEKYNLVVFGRNSKDLKVYNKMINQKLNRYEQIDTNVIIESNDFCKIYYFTIELYTGVNIKLKSNILSFKLEVNNDKEDEDLNSEFKNFPKLIVMPKNIKKGVKKILDVTQHKKDPMTIMQFLRNNNGNVEETIKNLNSFDKNNPVF